MNGYHRPLLMERPHGSYISSNNMHTGFIQRAPFSFPNGPFPRFPPVDPSYPPGISMPQHDTQRQEGPPFGDTRVRYSPITHHGVSVQPEIVANISKGFFQVDGKWTCYRRNYFTVFCSFNFGNRLADERLYLKLGHDKHGDFIQHFAVSISAKTASANNVESEPRGLVQHTPKRNKESETVPTRHVVVPSNPQQVHHQNGAMSLAGSGYPGPQTHPGYHYPNYHDPPTQSAPSSYTFERIQFQKATANNGKRRAQQQYFHVIVELYACVTRKHGEEEWVLIAERPSDAMVVRGRSPGHYKDSRRDSQTSMDPDRGTGPGSDGSSGGHHYSSYSSSGMEWQPSHGGTHHNPHVSRYEGGYRHCIHSDDSPPSASSSTTLTGSPNDLEFALSDADTLKSSDMYSLVRSRPTTPPSEVADDAFFSLGGTSLGRKRPLEEDSDDEESTFACSQPFSDTLSAHAFDLPPMAHSKVLCAS